MTNPAVVEAAATEVRRITAIASAPLKTYALRHATDSGFGIRRVSVLLDCPRAHPRVDARETGTEYGGQNPTEHDTAPTGGTVHKRSGSVSLK